MENEIMTPEEFAETMQSILEHYESDFETRHCRMDALMVDVLESLGYGEGTHIFRYTPKWYA